MPPMLHGFIEMGNMPVPNATILSDSMVSKCWYGHGHRYNTTMGDTTRYLFFFSFLFSQCSNEIFNQLQIQLTILKIKDMDVYKNYKYRVPVSNTRRIQSWTILVSQVSLFYYQFKNIRWRSARNRQTNSFLIETNYPAATPINQIPGKWWTHCYVSGRCSLIATLQPCARGFKSC